MDTAPVYLLKRFLFRIKEFFRHWYIKSAKIYWHFVISWLEKIDYTLAWRITLKNLFKPLYKDFSIMGYALGFFFRFMRLIFASVIYLIIFFIALGIYIVWLLIPPAVIFGALTNQQVTY